MKKLTYIVLTIISISGLILSCNPSSPKPEKTYKLSILKTGNGLGEVTSIPSGLSCGTICDSSFDKNTNITLTAVPDNKSKFVQWLGDCIVTGNSCVVSMSGNKTITAKFNKKPTLQKYKLEVSKIGFGSGKIVSVPNGIECGADCSEEYDINTVVTLTATPNEGSVFDGWKGDCSLTKETCSLIMGAARKVTANFIKEIAPSIELKFIFASTNKDIKWKHDGTQATTLPPRSTQITRDMKFLMVLSNKRNQDLNNILLTIVLPPEFGVIQNSVHAGEGLYDPELHQLTWQISKLSAKQTYSFDGGSFYFRQKPSTCWDKSAYYNTNRPPEQGSIGTDCKNPYSNPYTTTLGKYASDITVESDETSLIDVPFEFDFNIGLDF